MDRWYATYIIDPAGPRVASVSVEQGAHDDRRVGGWSVEGGASDAEPQGYVRVTQDLGEAAQLSNRMLRTALPGRAITEALHFLRTLHGYDSLEGLMAPKWLALVDQRYRAKPSRADRRLMLAATAAQYVAAIQDGERTPVRTVARALQLRPEQVRDRLHNARRAGLLERSDGQGRAGGKLTQAAIDLLNEEGTE